MNATLSSLSQELAGLIDRTQPSVVRVEARRRTPASGIVWAKGIIVAANHSVERDDHIHLGLHDGTQMEAELAGRDASSDIAVLRAATDHLPVPAWADASSLRLGHLVVAVARPLEVTAAMMGIASAVDGEWRTWGGGKLDRYLQTDLDLRPGFSGSALADAHGNVVGMNTSGLLRGRSLAVPTETIRRVVDAVLRKGHVQRGFLGIGSHPVRLPDEVAKKLGQETALIIVSVQPGGPADKAGLFIGDVLLSLDGKAIEDVGGLIALLDEDRIGADATAKILRAGETKDVRVTIGARSAA
jgi:S1-C subfamily serine protease